MSYDFPIGPVLEHYGWTVPPERAGNVPVKCMEHDDRQASASINFAKQVVKCHACDFSGDALKVIQIKEGCSFGEALAIAEGIVGEGNGGLPGAPRPRSSVSSGPRHRLFDRAYVPPRRGGIRGGKSR